VIAGVEIDVGAAAVWVRSATRLHVLASAVVGGDLDVNRHVVNMPAWAHHGRTASPNAG
jgi:hypothetical protein